MTNTTNPHTSDEHTVLLRDIHERLTKLEHEIHGTYRLAKIEAWHKRIQWGLLILFAISGYIYLGPVIGSFVEQIKMIVTELGIVAPR